MECDTCREALSARLDGEPEGVPAEQADEHLAACASCRVWEESAATLTRSLRVRPATAVPDLTAAIMAEAGELEPAKTRDWLPRMLLGGVAVAQLTLGLAQVIGGGTGGHGGHATGVGGSHLFNESTAWNLALGLGLLWTALRPAATSGTLPVTAAFVAVLVPYSASDLLSGTATVGRVLSHSLLLAGLALLALVHFAGRDPGGRTPAAGDESGETSTSGDLSGRADRPRTRRRVRLRPVTRHRAA
ncbi:zf-HC2 domain-containing protein [Lentzea fradiae]|uniref:zf-HC2 domain-containing protein n=1 Tax=Lentzea fradiae TaxID=200378 RepID=UPI001FDF99C1|nr:zf-HC2 domain-containing protein [Lentzea fradiae]